MRWRADRPQLPGPVAAADDASPGRQQNLREHPVGESGSHATHVQRLPGDRSCVKAPSRRPAQTRRTVGRLPVDISYFGTRRGPAGARQGPAAGVPSTVRRLPVDKPGGRGSDLARAVPLRRQRVSCSDGGFSRGDPVPTGRRARWARIVRQEQRRRRRGARGRLSLLRHGPALPRGDLAGPRAPRVRLLPGRDARPRR
jgi:hypothetical protein